MKERVKAPEAPCWLIWTLLNSGETVLRAVCTTEDTAELYREYALKALKVQRVMVEPSRLNHLYFGAFEKGMPDPNKVKKALKAAAKQLKKDAVVRRRAESDRNVAILRKMDI